MRNKEQTRNVLNALSTAFGLCSSERMEHVVFNITLDKELAQKYEKEIATISPDAAKTPSIMQDGDTVSIAYKFFIEYVGHVLPVLQALKTVLGDAKVVRKINMEELEHGECLIYELFKRYNEVKQACEGNI